MPYKSMVVALAGKEDEARVIREAVRLADEIQAQLTVLHVNDPSAGEITMMMESARLVTEADLRDQFRRLGFEQEADEIAINIVTGSSYPKEIAKATQGVDLLVIGHRQKHGFLAALIDSVDKHVADLVSRPVLVVPRG